MILYNKGFLIFKEKLCLACESLFPGSSLWDDQGKSMSILNTDNQQVKSIML